MPGSSFFSAWRRRRRERALERLEERDWRRRVVLVGQKLHSVQLALGEELADVRILRAQLEELGPEMERWQALLETSRSSAARLEACAAARAAELERIDELEEGLRKAEAQRARLIEHHTRERLAAEEDAERRVTAAREEERVAAREAAEAWNPYDDVRRAAMERANARFEERIDALTELVRDLDAEAEGARAYGAGDLVAQASLERIEELEDALRAAELRRTEEELGHTREMTEFADHEFADQMSARVSARVAGMGAELEQERARVCELEQRLRELEGVSELGPGDAGEGAEEPAEPVPVSAEREKVGANESEVAQESIEDLADLMRVEAESEPTEVEHDKEPAEGLTRLMRVEDEPAPEAADPGTSDDATPELARARGESAEDDEDDEDELVG